MINYVGPKTKSQVKARLGWFFAFVILTVLFSAVFFNAIIDEVMLSVILPFVFAFTFGTYDALNNYNSFKRTGRESGDIVGWASAIMLFMLGLVSLMVKNPSICILMLVTKDATNYYWLPKVFEKRSLIYYFSKKFLGLGFTGVMVVYAILIGLWLLWEKMIF